jgi:uncharacterized protein YifN (PemK superfamily)
MVKRRPVVVVSPQISQRAGLCTIVPLSTTPPQPQLPYHCRIILDPLLPKPWDAPVVWAKCDMVFACSLSRLDLIRVDKVKGRPRAYRLNTLSMSEMSEIYKGILYSFGLGQLTKYL